MRRQYNPRLRQSVEVTVSFQTYLQLKQEGKLIMENIENVITPEGIPGSSDSDQVMNQGKRNVRVNSKKFKHFKNTKKNNEQKKDSSVQIKTPGFNLFYPSNLGLGDRHKYSVSHYAINISPTYVELTSSGTYPYTQAELRAAYLYKLGLKLGGHNFHQKVLAAAYQANAKFLVTAGQIEALVNSFYDHMYTSRVLYSLLCTAWRCQQMVNAIDEDQLYISGLFNQHEDGAYSQGYNNTTFSTEVAMAAMANIAQRQAFCFSSPTSNGVWANSIVTPILQNVRLTEGWRSWVENKFMKVYAVDPTDFDMTPRYVVFWPTSKCGPIDSNRLLTTFSNYENYENATTHFGFNASINSLITYINTLCAHQTQLIQTYPQLQLMWDYLNMSAGTTSFTRDLDAKSFPVVHSYSVSKFIRSCSLPLVKYYRSATTADTVFTGAGTSVLVLNDIIISKDPVVKESSFKTFEMPSSSRNSANITYIDRTELDEVDMAMCTGQVAGLSLQLLVLNSSNLGFQWGFPIGSLSTGLAAAYTPVGTEFGSDAYNIVNAYNQLNAILTQGAAVLSRHRLVVTTRPSDLIIAVNNTVPYYDLKDYIVPSIEGQEWADRFRDEVLTK